MHYLSLYNKEGYGFTVSVQYGDWSQLGVDFNVGRCTLLLHLYSNSTMMQPVLKRRVAASGHADPGSLARGEVKYAC